MGSWLLIIGGIIIVVTFILEKVNKAWIYNLIAVIGLLVVMVGGVKLGFSVNAEVQYKEKLGTISYYETEIEISPASELNQKGLNNEPMFNGLIDEKYEKATIRNGGNFAIVTIYYEDGTNKAYALSEDAFMKDSWYTIKE